MRTLLKGVIGKKTEQTFKKSLIELGDKRCVWWRGEGREKFRMLTWFYVLPTSIPEKKKEFRPVTFNELSFISQTSQFLHRNQILNIVIKEKK